MPERYTLRAFGLDPNSSMPLNTDLLSGALPNSSAGSWNRALSLVVAIHNCAGVEPPAVKRKPNPPGRTRWLTAEEWVRLHKALKRESPLLAQCAEFAIYTGLRENNVLNLGMSNDTDTAYYNETHEVYFFPQDGITLQELVAILQQTIFYGPGDVNGLYSKMPPELQRHFRVVPKTGYK